MNQPKKPSKPDPVPRSKLSTMAMVAGNEDLYHRVVDGDRLRAWVAIGWIDEGMATDEHRSIYPTVVDA